MFSGRGRRCRVRSEGEVAGVGRPCPGPTRRLADSPGGITFVRAKAAGQLPSVFFNPSPITLDTKSKSYAFEKINLRISRNHWR